LQQKIYCNIGRESAATIRKNYYNISNTTNATSKKRLLQQKSTAISRENLPQQQKKQNKTSQELLCNIRETPIATTKKDTVATLHIICCNIKNESLQNNDEI